MKWHHAVSGEKRLSFQLINAKRFPNKRNVYLSESLKINL